MRATKRAFFLSLVIPHNYLSSRVRLFQTNNAERKSSLFATAGVPIQFRGGRIGLFALLIFFVRSIHLSTDPLCFSIDWSFPFLVEMGSLDDPILLVEAWVDGWVEGIESLLLHWGIFLDMTRGENIFLKI